MNLFMQMLAQTESAPPVAPGGDPITQPDQPVPEYFFSQIPLDKIWQIITQISWMQAVVCIAFATIYLIYGWRIFMALVIINFAVIGLLVGRMAGIKLGSSPQWGGILGTVILGVVSWPFVKYSVSILGAGAGTILGAALWQAATLPPKLFWVGALVGLIAGGFLAFTSFRVSIILFTALQGSALLSIGILALLHKYPNFSPRLAQAFFGSFLLPIMVLGLSSISIYIQNKLYTLRKNWDLPK